MKSVIIITAFALSQSALGQGSDSLRVASDKTVGGFVFPESCGYHAGGKALYVGNFGGAKLDPAAKDGQGYISKVALDGKVLEQKFLPAAGGETLNKPKGIWIQGDRLWVADIDAVWIFDLKSKKGRKLALPGVGFANDPAVMGKTLYVSDNRNDKLVKVEPADFLNAKKEPSVTAVFSGAGVNPNGVYPARSGMLYMVGFLAADKPKPIFVLGVSGQIKQLSEPIGRLDGIYEMKDGSLLFTDWNTGSLSRWSEKGGVQKLADGFKGPADFCVVPGAGGAMTVVGPDLPQSQLRFIQLSK
jgi:sugar lactone lactonase YvrE